MGILALTARLLRLLRPHRLLVYVVLGAIIIDQAFDTVLRLSFKFLIDEVLAERDGRVMAALVGFLLAEVLVTAILAGGRGYLYAKLGAKAVNELRADLFGHLQRLSIGFFSRSQTADIEARFSTDLAAVESAIALALPTAAVCVVSGVFVIIALLVLEWHMAVPALLLLPLCILGPKWLGPRTSQASYDKKEQQAVLASLVHESLATQTIVKAYSLQTPTIARFRAQLDTLAVKSVRAGFLGFLMERTPNIAVSILQLLVMSAGGVLAFYDFLSVGDFVAFFILFVSVSESVTGITWVIPYLLEAAAGMRRIDELLREAPQVADPAQPATLAPSWHRITIDDVTFAYLPEQPVLSHVSLAIPRGASVAFVGASGSGKSTVLNLLLRFYDPTVGALRIDGQDLRAVTQDDLRLQIGAVFQESLLFDTSIRENIRLGRSGATDEEVERAARAAEIHEFIMSLPQAYETQVGERGAQLSGGQRQRIARALVREPAILLLDEATAALDPVTEASINATLSRVGLGRTMVSVTHRLGSAMHADRLFVFDKGRVVEAGRHDELLQLNGVYAELWRKQSGFIIHEEGERRASALGPDPRASGDATARGDLAAVLDRALRRRPPDCARRGPGRSFLRHRPRQGSGLQTRAGREVPPCRHSERRGLLWRDRPLEERPTHRHGPRPDALPPHVALPRRLQSAGGERAGAAGDSREGPNGAADRACGRERREDRRWLTTRATRARRRSR